eukprot:7187710-Heterocapsa_arctica.AAC.1
MEATNKGVEPSWYALSLTAPALQSCLTTSRWPSKEAVNKGVAPSWVALSLSAPALHSCFTTSS